MRPREIVEALPFSQLPVKVYVTGICQQLVEFLLISPVRMLDLAIIRYEMSGADSVRPSSSESGVMVSPSGTRGTGSTKVRAGRR